MIEKNVAQIGLISDIQSNKEALDQVLNQLSAMNVNQICCLGDTLGYGPDPRYCLQTLRRLEATIILGNHDAAILKILPINAFYSQAKRALEWTRMSLTEEELSFLSQKETSLQLSWGRLFHGSIKNPLREYIFEKNTARKVFNASQRPQQLFCHGHTHQPRAFIYDGQDIISPAVKVNKTQGEKASGYTLKLDRDQGYLINPGSVGQPRDGDPRASFAVLRLEDGIPTHISWYRISYDLERTRDKIIKKRLPVQFGDRLRGGQ